MTMRPDPTFHASPKLAMEAPPENFAYTLLLSPNAVHFAIWMAAVKSMRVVGSGVRGRSG